MKLHICCAQKGEKACSEQQKAAMHIGFWKLCTAAMHVDTANKKSLMSFKNYYWAYLTGRYGRGSTK